MNRRVKFRESFRPFAPAVLLEDVTTYFEWDRESPCMAFVARGHTRRHECPHTVDAERHGRFWRLLKEFKRHGLALLLLMGLMTLGSTAAAPFIYSLF
jgi:predicted NodU family carbamoyl transferase